MLNLKSLLQLILFLVLALIVGPRIYVFLEIPRSMKPVNYYDFMNSFLLMLIAYKLLIKK